MTEDAVIAALRAYQRTSEGRRPASVENVLRVEHELDLRLPAFLRRLYLEVADGGFGPGYGLFRLAGTTSELVDQTLDKRGLVPDSGEPWHKDLVCICTFGCTYYAGVDCRTDRGAVYLFEEHHGLNGQPEKASIGEWFAAWLKGHVNPYGRVL